jgi:hypothetical protein
VKIVLISRIVSLRVKHHALRCHDEVMPIKGERATFGGDISIDNGRSDHPSN